MCCFTAPSDKISISGAEPPASISGNTSFTTYDLFSILIFSPTFTCKVSANPSFNVTSSFDIFLEK